MNSPGSDGQVTLQGCAELDQGESGVGRGPQQGEEGPPVSDTNVSLHFLTHPAS